MTIRSSFRIEAFLRTRQELTVGTDTMRHFLVTAYDAFWQRCSEITCRAGDYVKTKRALIRAVEKQAEMEERMDLLKACILA